MVKRIAVVGSGISGLLCARLLATQHEVTLFEAADCLGGHTHTVDVEVYGKSWTVDTGFMVFNDRTYPNFMRMLELLDVESRASDMSFSVCCRRTGLEYQGSSLNGLFAQRRNLVRPSFYRLLRDVLRFNRRAPLLLDSTDERQTLAEYLVANRYSNEFAQQYLLPMTAAIWSAPPDAMAKFPVKFLARFLQNHGLLQITNRPQWRTIVGGARRYVEKVVKPLGDGVRIGSKVAKVRRSTDGVELTVTRNDSEAFDSVVLATHAPQSLAMLAEPTEAEREVLGKFRYQENVAYLHTDRRMLPSRQRAWASWNYRLSEDTSLPAAVTYDLSRLQGVDSPEPILQTLNPTEAIEPSKVLQKLYFEHPLFDEQTCGAQQERARLHQDGKIFYCGAYWGYGFHEDGVVSALEVCKHFDITLEHLARPCIAASTKV